MSYISDNLLPGESVRYIATRHWIVLVIPFVVGSFLLLSGTMAVIIGLTSTDPDSGILTGVSPSRLIFFGGFFLFFAYMRRKAIEMAVTSRRIIAKHGVIRTRSIEISHAKVESIQIDQSLLGKMCGYGTVTIRGVGGTPEPFSKISSPFEFRRQVQSLLDPAV